MYMNNQIVHTVNWPYQVWWWDSKFTWDNFPWWKSTPYVYAHEEDIKHKKTLRNLFIWNDIEILYLEKKYKLSNTESRLKFVQTLLDNGIIYSAEF